MTTIACEVIDSQKNCSDSRTKASIAVNFCSNYVGYILKSLHFISIEFCLKSGLTNNRYQKEGLSLLFS